MKKKQIPKLVIFCFLLFTSQWVFAQSRTISGTVLDEKGAGLEGATISVKGSNTAIVTDGTGHFTLKVPQTAKALEISFLNYATQQVNIAGKDAISVKMALAEQAISDVVVIGYGTVKKKDLTGSLTTISAKNLNPGPVTSPMQMIAGKAAGVNVVQIGSEPGSTPGIRIRGISSLTAGSDPLVVIDGVQGDLSIFRQLIPSDIESVDILKDASATAVYGSRGAAGVIIVTTKTAKPAESSIQVSSTASVDIIRKSLEMLSADEWWAYAQKWSVPADANHGANTDWVGLLTRNGFTQNHTISASGGTKSFNYRASVAAQLQKGVVINSKFNSYIANIQMSQKALNDRLTLKLDVNNNVLDNTPSPGGGIGAIGFQSNLISNALQKKPTDPIYNSDGSYFVDRNVFDYVNPYAVAKEIINKSESNKFFSSLNVNLKLIKGLTANWFGVWRKSDDFGGNYTSAKTTIPGAVTDKGQAGVGNSYYEERLMNMGLNYKKSIGEHSFDVLALYEYQTQLHKRNGANARGFINDATSYHALQLGDITKARSGDAWSSRTARELISYMGRVNYNFMDKYLLTASIRRDGSTVFGKNYPWGYFPAAAVAWKLKNEDFISGITWLSDLKLRAGYGATGNQGLAPYQTLRLVAGQGVTYFAGNLVQNFGITQNDNRDLRWETKKQANLGVDFSIFRGTLSGTVDVYRSLTSNLLYDYGVPQPPYPFESIKANVGSFVNKGIEVALEYQAIRKKDMSLTLAGNFTYATNTINSLNGSLNGVPLTTAPYIGWGNNSYLIKGMPLGTFRLYKFNGIDENGSAIVADLNGNKTTGLSSDLDIVNGDQYNAGQSMPKYLFAFNPSFNWKNWTVTMLWRGQGGHKIYNGIRSYISTAENLGKINLLKSAAALNLYTSKYNTDLFLEKGDYVRFENFSVSYNLPRPKVNGVDAIKINFTATNLAVITKYSGADPELGGAYGGAGDGGIYPRTTNIALGLNVTFK